MPNQLVIAGASALAVTVAARIIAGRLENTQISAEELRARRRRGFGE